MSRTRTIYLPAWVPWFVLLFIAPTWLWISYRVLFTTAGRADLGIGGWVIVTFMTVVIQVVLFLMGYRKLSAYVIQDHTENND